MSQIDAITVLDAHNLPPDTWVVCPAYNEGERIGKVLDELTAVTSNVVVVVDGAKDDTVKEASRHPVWVVEHPINLGQGAALQTGIDFALSRGAQYIVTFDSDGQHLAEDIPVLVSALINHSADYALGSRFLGNAIDIPLGRLLILKLAVLFTRILSGIQLTDTHNGARAMTRRGASCVRITLNRMEHASEIIDQIGASGLKWVEVPVTIRYTAASLGKGQRNGDAIKLAAKLLLERVTNLVSLK